MSSEDDDLIVKVGIAVGAYFLVVRPLLNSVGIDPADQAAVAAVNTTSPSANPWSVQFAPFIAKYQSLWTQPGWTEQLYFQSLKACYEGSEITLTNGTTTGCGDDPITDYNGSNSDIAVMGEAINNAFTWYEFSPDNDAVIGVFNHMTSQVDVAAVAAYLFYNYGKDLFSWLQNGVILFNLFAQGLNTNVLAQLIAHVNALPQNSY